MIINDGSWSGEQLLPEAFVNRLGSGYLHLTEEQSRRCCTDDKPSTPGHTYFWWPLDMTAGKKTFSTKSAQGAGGVTIIAMEELDLVVVITGHSREVFLRMIAEKMVPVSNP